MPPLKNFRKQTYNFFATARNIDAVEHDYAVNDNLASSPIVSMSRACKREYGRSTLLTAGGPRGRLTRSPRKLFRGPCMIPPANSSRFAVTL